jgi:6-phosphogluconolactonase/glucosamine-6-phosphate isomerase/deaminase
MMGKQIFYRVNDENKAAELLANDLHALAASRKILFLIPGGSGIDLAIKILGRASTLKDQLVISLTDERYGPVGHADSNWASLKNRGLKTEDWHCYEILQGQSAVQTAIEFSNFLTDIIKQGYALVALLGMGADGHTSGVLPGSPAVNSADLVTTYKAADFERITTTPRFLKSLDRAYLYATGESKHQQLARLQQNLSVDEQPAMILKQAKILTVFNDFIGEEL